MPVSLLSSFHRKMFPESDLSKPHTRQQTHTHRQHLLCHANGSVKLQHTLVSQLTAAKTQQIFPKDRMADGAPARFKMTFRQLNFHAAIVHVGAIFFLSLQSLKKRSTDLRIKLSLAPENTYCRLIPLTRTVKDIL